jgi:uncharacterized membrane protein
MHLVLALILVILGLAAVFLSIYVAKNHQGDFGKREVLKYSLASAASLSLALSAFISHNLMQFLTGLILFAPLLTIVISLQWLFSRYVAGKAEAAGRSYVAFLVISILFPLIGLIIVLLFQPNTNARSAQQAPAGNSNLSEELTKLQSLKESGILSEEEFTKAKNKLIS